MCSCFGGIFQQAMHFVKVFFEAMHCFTVSKSCLIPVACLNVSEYLPFLIPYGVLCFRKNIGQDKEQASEP